MVWVCGLQQELQQHNDVREKLLRERERERAFRRVAGWVNRVLDGRHRSINECWSP